MDNDSVKLAKYKLAAVALEEFQRQPSADESKSVSSTSFSERETSNHVALRLLLCSAALRESFVCMRMLRMCKLKSHPAENLSLDLRVGRPQAVFRSDLSETRNMDERKCPATARSDALLSVEPSVSIALHYIQRDSCLLRNLAKRKVLSPAYWEAVRKTRQ